MFAIVKDGAITKTGPSLKGLFPNVSFPASGPDNDWKTTEGIKEIVQGVQKDQQYYFVTEGNLTLVDGVPTQQYTNTAKRLVDETIDGVLNQGLKSVMTNKVKYNAGQLLSNTDWMVIRKYERDVAIPSATATYRAAVITECTRLESAIAGAGDVDALATVMNAQNWPTES
tara:strand:- start:15746 stop:16258 length:513 start_codon:yes stop_codon:yes gene_type:complete